MKADIERVIRADEVAREKLVEAGERAQQTVAEARRQAEQWAAQKRRESTTLLEAEGQTILSGAHSKAQQILQETDKYLEQLRTRKETRQEALIRRLVKEVTGF